MVAPTVVIALALLSVACASSASDDNLASPVKQPIDEAAKAGITVSAVQTHDAAARFPYFVTYSARDFDGMDSAYQSAIEKASAFCRSKGLNLSGRSRRPRLDFRCITGDGLIQE